VADVSGCVPGCKYILEWVVARVQLGVGVADASDCCKRPFAAKPSRDLKLWAIT